MTASIPSSPSQAVDPSIPRVWIETITFSSGQTVALAPDDILILVGPNNSGKSAALRNIHSRIRSPGSPTLVIQAVTTRFGGDEAGIRAWLPTVARQTSPSNSDPGYNYQGYGFHLSTILDRWRNPGQPLADVANLFCALLTADQRLAGGNHTNSFAVAQDAPANPIQRLYVNVPAELSLSEKFVSAFGLELIVHRTAGSVIPLYTGVRPVPASRAYTDPTGFAEELQGNPTLESQGDGMRSFATILLNATLQRESVVLIDEPEAFLHPPQARLLARTLANEVSGQRQLVVATHSGDIVRGLLDASHKRVRVVRIERDGAHNRIRELSRDMVVSLWSDPLLRHSNILDGLFHELVVICESDADARFYSSVADAVLATLPNSHRRRDAMFVHCGGKDRIPTVMKSLRSVGVPVSCIADFDVLKGPSPLKAIVEAADGDWAQLQADLGLVEAAIDTLDPPFEAGNVIAALTEIASKITVATDLDEARKGMNAVFKQNTQWALAKRSGVDCITNTAAQEAFTRVNASLRAHGIFVVECGELERFLPTLGGHGPKWVLRALEKDIANDPEFQQARLFLRTVLNI